MTQTTVFTGSPGPGIATAAAARALHTAAQGQRTLLLSVGSAASLGALLGQALGAAPTAIGPGCDALAIDGLAELANAWVQNRSQLPPGLAQLAGDELPLLPGLELAFALLRLRELAPRYDAVLLDAGPHDMLLRGLSAPDSLRWAVRLLFGLDRGPGRSAASLGRALLPTSFIPSDAFAGVQDARVRAEQLRDMLLGPDTSCCYVLRPDSAALEDARIGIPALQLHALAVRSIAIGPLLPPDLADARLLTHIIAQDQLLADVATTWPARHTQQFSLLDSHGGLDGLARIAATLGAPDRAPSGPPILTEWAGAPALAIELPGLPKGALQLTLSGDELIVRVGAYRRHILLPDSLRGATNIKATREGEHLVVRRR